jgi:hypothetical protein
MNTKRAWLSAGILMASVLTYGCETPSIPTVTTLPSAEYLALRCVSGSSEGLPLEACGCSERAGDGEGTRVRLMGRVECTCRTADGRAVGAVEAAPCADGLGQCPRLVDGDWIPGVGANTLPCVARRSGSIRGYVGSNAEQRVMFLSVTDGAGEATRRILDIDSTIPGVTGLYVDDLMTDLEADPDGRFIFSVVSNGPVGALGVLLEDGVEAVRVEFGYGPLLDADVWPPIERVTERDSAAEVAPRRVFISAPIARVVLEIDLDTLLLVAHGEAEPDSAVVGCYGLSASADCDVRIGEDDIGGYPGRLAVSPDGSRLYVGHRGRPIVTEFSLTAEGGVRQVDLTRRRPCDDGYLVRVETPQDDPTCSDGLDNDADGLVDGADLDCLAINSEASNPRCPKQSQCADGADNDGDGLVDAEDDDCGALGADWEGPVPACADGVDNDGDGLADRDDPGCATEGDRDEGDLERRYDDLGAMIDDSACQDGLDNDADGLTDEADPGCHDLAAAQRYRQERRPQCGDGIDNDHDGHVDYGEDDDCYAAGDRSEGESAQEVGPTQLVVVDAPLQGGRTFLYVTDPGGFLMVVDVDQERLEPRVSGIRRTPLSMAVRRGPLGPSLLTVTDEGTLRSVDVLAEDELQTDDGRAIFARLIGPAVNDPQAWARQVRVHGPGVEAFYVIFEGVALAAGLGDLCTPQRCGDEGAECGEGEGCHGGWCLPAACAVARDCGGDQGCVEGACASLCDPTDEAACGGARSCRIGPHPLSGEDGEADGICASPCSLTADGAVTLDYAGRPPFVAPESLEEAAALAVPVVDHGARDPVVLRRGGLVEHHGERNIHRRALARSSRIVAAPKPAAAGVGVRTDASVHPVFCQLPQVQVTEGGDAADQAAAFDVSLACLPPGQTYNCASARLEPESEAVGAARLQHRVDVTEEIVVVEKDPFRVPIDDFTVSYEGVIPRSESEHGIFGEGEDNAGWTLYDYNANYCGLGVEVGDVVLFDPFVPETAQTDCSAFELAPNARIEQNREPLRYVVAALTPHSLDLVRDERAEYGQRLENNRTAPPRPAPGPLAATKECASQALSYRIRVGNDQWIVTGARTRLRHPWVQRGGVCAAAPSRAKRRGRFRLGEVFENEWFRFRLGGYAPPLEQCPEGSPAPDLDPRPPAMVDLTYAFSLVPGRALSQLQSAAVLPRQMRWLPNEDRLLLVDGALDNVLEFAGFDIFVERMAEIRRFE